MYRALDLYPWIAERFGPVKEEQGGAYVNTPCPLKCHRTATVRWWVWGDERALCFKCWAGCPKLEILRAVGAGWKDCFQPGADLARVKQEIVARYPYHDEAGALLYETLRLEPGLRGRDKDFRQRRKDPATGKWVWNLDGVRRVLYRLHDLTTTPSDRERFVVGGEKDVETLRALGLTATTNVCGERAEWLDSYSEALTDRHVVVVQDRDSAGKRHANEVCGSLLGHTRSVRRVALPTKDTTAFVNNLRRDGVTDRAELRDLFLEAALDGVLWERAEVLYG